jgi:hypothetical protein
VVSDAALLVVELEATAVWEDFTVEVLRVVAAAASSPL